MPGALALRSSLGAALVLLVATTACVPAVLIRRTALLPSDAPPARAGTPLEPGETRLSADVGPVRLDAGLTALGPGRVGGPGAYVPTFTVGGSVYHGLGKVGELGAHFRYASYAWSEPSAIGVLPIPEGGASIYGGVGGRLNFRVLERRVTISPLLELNLVHTTEAHYYCQACELTAPTSDAAYIYEGAVDSTLLMPKLGLVVDVRTLDALHVFGGISAQRGFTNVGFDDRPETRGYGSVTGQLVGLPMVGLAADLGLVQLASTLSLPLAEGGADRGLRLSLSVSLRLGLPAPERS